MALDSALGTADTLAGEPPQEPLTLEAVRGAGRRPHYEVVRGGGGDRVDQRLQGLLVHVLLLWVGDKSNAKHENSFDEISDTHALDKSED